MVTDARSRDIHSSEVSRFHLSLQENCRGEVYPVPVNFMKHDYLFTAMDAKRLMIHSSWPGLLVKGLGFVQLFS